MKMPPLPKGKEPVKFKNGDILYVKQFQKSLSPLSQLSQPFSFQGMAVCMLLGQVKNNNGPDASIIEVTRSLGQVGLMTFDDIAEFVGDEQAKICIQKWGDKYYPKKKEGEAETPSEPLPENVKPLIHLVDKYGKDKR